MNKLTVIILISFISITISQVPYKSTERVEEFMDLQKPAQIKITPEKSILKSLADKKLVTITIAPENSIPNEKGKESVNFEESAKIVPEKQVLESINNNEEEKIKEIATLLANIFGLHSKPKTEEKRKIPHHVGTFDRVDLNRKHGFLSDYFGLGSIWDVVMSQNNYDKLIVQLEKIMFLGIESNQTDFILKNLIKDLLTSTSGLNEIISKTTTLLTEYTQSKENNEDNKTWRKQLINEAFGIERILESISKVPEDVSNQFYQILAELLISDDNSVFNTKLVLNQLTKDFVKNPGIENLILKSIVGELLKISSPH